MSIEIKELVVKFNVTENQDKPKAKNEVALTPANYKKLVKECTEKVLQEIEFKIER